MSVRAEPVDLRQKYMWKLAMARFDSALFTECDSPQSEFDTVEFDSAGTVHSIKHPGRRKFNVITFRKGMLLDRADTVAYDWFKLAGDSDTGESTPPSRLKRDVDLSHLDGSGIAIETFTLIGAWISKLEMEKLEGKSSDFLLETGTITYDRFERRAGA